MDPFEIAYLCVRLGRTDQAIEYLHRAYEQRSPELSSLNALPTLQPLHGDPRFQALLVKLGLE